MLRCPLHEPYTGCFAHGRWAMPLPAFQATPLAIQEVRLTDPPTTDHRPTDPLTHRLTDLLEGGFALVSGWCSGVQ